ncbi:hypothetical protein TorRG33x02_281490 [Trema orientale]|uniref:Uncharacterized protein n=1 Tax=Trema orientale TaxID=63057 RepID=A0A2P5CKD4_TREOI|nr:hypothetical protein TorRG33x02_281490 [Trema orientale]
MSKFNVASDVLANSFYSLTSSQATLLAFIIFVTNDQLLDFGQEMKESNAPKMVRVINSTSLNMLIISTFSCSFLRELNLHWFSKALWSAFFTTFLDPRV